MTMRKATDARRVRHGAVGQEPSQSHFTSALWAQSEWKKISGSDTVAARSKKWQGCFPGAAVDAAQFAFATGIQATRDGRAWPDVLVMQECARLAAEHPESEMLQWGLFVAAAIRLSGCGWYWQPHRHWLGVPDPQEFLRVSRVCFARSVSEKSPSSGRPTEEFTSH